MTIKNIEDKYSHILEIKNSLSKNELKKVEDFLEINQEEINIKIIDLIEESNFLGSFCVKIVEDLNNSYNFYNLGIADLIDLIEIYKTLLNTINQITGNNTAFKLKYLLSETIERFELLYYSKREIKNSSSQATKIEIEKIKQYIDYIIGIEEIEKRENNKSIKRNQVNSDKFNDLLIAPNNVAHKITTDLPYTDY